jgi:hypothetical protein
MDWRFGSSGRMPLARVKPQSHKKKKKQKTHRNYRKG